MADSVVRLKVESQEYDQKLKRAQDGLTRYADECRKVGGTLEVVEKDTLEYVRALGQMDTVSRTATGKLAELKKTFTELSVVYKNMTNEEKQSPFGKALSQSLDQLKGRINESKVQLDDVSKSLNGSSGLSSALDSIAGKFGMNIEQLTKFGGVLGAASAALKVSKDAFFASEQNIDEWGRVVASGESVYEGFLTALNTGDISGYLNNINTIINAAREAYNELDRLSTQKAIDNSRSKAQMVENERMRAMLRTGRYIAPNDGRKASMAEGTILTDAQKQAIAKQLENGLKTANSIVRSEIDQTTKAINALYKEQASVLQMSSKEFRAGTSSMAEFDKRLEGYKNYVDFERQHTYNDGRSAVSHRDNAANPYEQYKAWGVFKDDGKLFQKINELINQRASLQSQNYSNNAQAYRSINTATKPGGGGGGSRGGSGGGGKTIPEYIPLEGSIDAQTKKVQDLQKAWRAAADDDSRQKIKAQIDEANHELDYMTGKIKPVGKMEEVSGVAPNSSSMLTDLQGVTISIKTPLQELTEEMKRLQEEQAKVFSPEGWQIYQQRINEVQGKIDEFKGNNGINDMSKSWRTAQQAINGVGSAMSGLKNPAIDIMTVIGQSIATIALAYSETLAKDTTSKSNIWSFIAAAAAATVSMATTIASLHSATGYAEGGIIKGNSYSGDNIPIMANAGEVVLTKAMTNNLAAGIQSQGMGGWQLKTRLAGTDLLLSVERTLQKQGYGKIATWG